jgi:hypothetical protein
MHHTESEKSLFGFVVPERICFRAGLGGGFVGWF